MQKKIMPDKLTGGWIGEGFNYLVELYRQEEVNSSLTQSASVAAVAVRGMKILKPGRWMHGMMRCGSCVRFS